MKLRVADWGMAALLAAFIHGDWHLARPGPHGSLSGHFAQHWLVAIPIFAVLAVVISRRPQGERWRHTAWIIGLGVLIGQILEPVYEVLVDRLSWSWLLQALRWTAFAEFLAIGLSVLVLVLAWAEASSAGSAATWHRTGD